MQLIIDASTVEELMEKVCALANKFGVDLSESTKTPVTKEVVEAAKTIAVEPEVEEAPKKEKKAKKEKEVVVETSTVEEVKTYTKQDITNACQELSEAKGLDKAREVLGKFGAKRISEIKEEDYGAFINACKAEI
jgi:hypothetical protein